MLIDSNLLIYASRPEYTGLERWVAKHVRAASAISLVEVLGYHKLTGEAKAFLQNLFAPLEILYPIPVIFECAITLRQRRKMTLGDALIAATCLEHGLPLATANVSDFDWVDGLQVVNPLTHTP